jgi:hypothetical protein
MRSQAMPFVSVNKEATSTNLVEETLVVDERSSCRPAQAVEDKLNRMVAVHAVGVSQLRLRKLLSRRTKEM